MVLIIYYLILFLCSIDCFIIDKTLNVIENIMNNNIKNDSYYCHI